MIDSKKDHLAQIKERLYSREKTSVGSERSAFSPERTEVESGWQTGITDNNMPRQKRISLPYFVLIIAALFFAVSAAVAFYSFSTGRNVISSDNIEIEIKGPVSLRGGEELTLQILVTNKNSVALESADLAIIYPAGTRDAEDLSKELFRSPRYLDTLDLDETARETARAVLFGKENETKEITILLEYRTAGSNAIFEKRKTYSLVITDVPVNLTLSVPEEVSAGEEFPIEVNITSNSSQTLSEMYLNIEYPEGFVFRGADIRPLAGNDFWSLGDISPGLSKTIVIRGTISGESEEIKTISASLGLRKGETEREVSVPYNTAFEDFLFKRPFIALDFSLDGNIASEFVADPGRKLRGDIFFENTLSDIIRDGEITATFSGRGLDQFSVSAGEGFYRSADQTIIWRPQNVPALSELPSGERGQASFNFGILPSAILSSGGTNPTINIDFTFRGNRVSPSFASQEVVITKRAVIKISSKLSLSSRAIYSVGPFVNTGPLPPRVNHETSYTIVWNLSNTSSDVRDVVVQAVLPTYVKWLGIISPPGEEVSYNSASGRVSWVAGSVPAGTGLTAPTKEVAFQIAFTPSISQIGQKPELLFEASMTGRDSFTGRQLSAGAGELSTELETDPNFLDIQARVMQ